MPTFILKTVFELPKDRVYSFEDQAIDLDSCPRVKDYIDIDGNWYIINYVVWAANTRTELYVLRTSTKTRY